MITNNHIFAKKRYVYKIKFFMFTCLSFEREVFLCDDIISVATNILTLTQIIQILISNTLYQKYFSK